MGGKMEQMGERERGREEAGGEGGMDGAEGGGREEVGLGR